MKRCLRITLLFGARLAGSASRGCQVELAVRQADKKQGQKLGFSLDEISELLSLEEGRHCREAKEIALRKLILIRERIEGLRTMEAALSDSVDSCASNTDPVSCPIIQALLKTTA